jgi:hypothetical protein
MRTQLQSARGLMAGLLLASALACGDDPVSPEMQAASGNYVATQLVTTEGGTATDQLAAGATITLTLSPNGTTSGRFIVPGELDASLAGSWTITGTTVRLSHSADTFLRNTDFQVQGNTLVGDENFGGTRVQVTLTRQ